MVAVPSLIDNLPNTCLEAMALGRCVVATTGSCFEQLIQDGESGILCAPGDPEALRGALERAWSLPEEKRTAVGDRARQRIQELAPEHKVPELVSYYQSLIHPESVPAKTALGVGG